MSVYDLAKSLFNDPHQDSKTKNATVRYGTVCDINPVGNDPSKISVIFDGSAAPITLSCETPVALQQRVALTNDNGRYRVIALGTMVNNLNTTAVTANEAHDVVDTLIANNITADQLYTAYACIDELVANSITTNELEAAIATIQLLNVDELVAAVATIESLNVDKITAGIAYVDYLTANNISASSLAVDFLNAASAVITNVAATNILTKYLSANTIDVDRLRVNTINGVDISNPQSLQNLINYLYSYNSTTHTVSSNLETAGAININASNLTSGVIDADVTEVINLNASNIITGTIDASCIAAGSITTNKIASGAVTANQIASGTITSNQINVSQLFSTDLQATGNFKVGVLDTTSSDPKYAIEYDKATNKISLNADSLTAVTHNFVTTDSLETQLNSIANNISNLSSLTDAANASIQTNLLAMQQQIENSKSELETVQSIISFSELIPGVPAVTLATSLNGLSMMLTNTELSFNDNGERVAYVNNQTLGISKAEISNQLKIGNYAFISGESDHITLTHIG